ncbi:MAG TPA: UDP-glucose 4-epimerase GalE [Blastocatellia bacterium]|nr:UDP-glucose 4-epimerase GalE [Blastocatellia bacterium]
MAILVTGGAGYIGSVTVEHLLAEGESVVILDNLSRGHRAALAPDIPFYQGDVGDRALLRHILSRHDIDSCIHFAALAYVGESVAEPARYFENNVEQGLALLGVLLEAGVRQFVFSSSCAVYGEPERIPIPEDHPQRPTNPYGWSKFMLERALEWYDRAYNLKFVSLRYFNAAGATARHGEIHEPETHLIPNVLRAAEGRIPFVSIYGTTYPTPDGTAIRDYIHVADLATAHLQALRYLRSGGRSECLNLGTGRGYSVREVIDTARRITGCPISVENAPPRPGDPSRLVADATRARLILGWEPVFSDLETIIRSAWKWQMSQRHS